MASLEGTVMGSAVYNSSVFTGANQVEPCLFVATAGSVMIRYTLNIPPPEERLTQPTTSLVLGES